ncbi:hypothetical protein J4E05_14780 [Thalassospira sp. NFXS8]|uniref:hypothetical protein n=1 Tax=Thalassospira sp. NFXS8 TaxID=2819093 RepID=UPI0032DE33B8
MSYAEMQWEKGEIEIDRIILDKDNPRLGPYNQNSDVSAMAYLIQHENVLGLAANIADYKNLFPNERIICIPVEDNQYMVLEGNRRVAACKLLLAPHNIGAAGSESDVPVIDPATRKAITFLDACIVDTRTTADEIIAKLHIEEFGKLSWNTRKKIRYVESRLRFGNDIEFLADSLGISTSKLYELKSYGRVFTYLTSMINWTQAEKDILWDDKLDLDVLFTVITSKVISNHFGQSLFSDAGEINYDFPKRDEICKKITQHTLISQRMKVDYKYSKGTPIRDYLHERFPRKTLSQTKEPYLDLTTPKGVIDTGGVMQPPNSVTPSPTEAPDKNQDDTPEINNPRYDRARLLRSLDYSTTKDRRLKQLAAEARQISKIKPDATISISFIIRAILERGLTLEIKKSNLSQKLSHKKNPTVDELINFISSNKNQMEIPPALIRSLNSAKEKKFTFEINQNIHDGFGNTSPEHMNQLCGHFLPIFNYFLEKN